jgi:hypothetical protein
MPSLREGGTVTWRAHMFLLSALLLWLEKYVLHTLVPYRSSENTVTYKHGYFECHARPAPLHAAVTI